MTTTQPGPVILTSEGGAELYAQADRLRAAGPAVRVQLPEGVIAWSVTRGDLVKMICSHPQVSKDARRSWPGYVPGTIGWLFPWTDVESMLTTDGSEHTRLRNLVADVFAPKRVQALVPVLEAIVADLLDTMSALPAGQPVDLRAAFTYPVPTRLICGLFGVPDDQRPGMLAVIDAVLTTDATGEQAAAVNTAMVQAMQQLIAAKRETPGDDMTSHLLAAQQRGGDHLTDQEVVSTLILMIGAGSQTATALISHATRELLRQPDQLAAVRAAPALWDEVVAEALRLHPPIMHMPLRYATADIDLGDGVVIRDGDAIIVGFGAHGRDPDVHDNPGLLDIHRQDKRQMAFGYGIHHCLGAPLARLEGRIALQGLFESFPDLRAVDPDQVQPHRSFIGNDVQALPVLLGRPATAAGTS